VCTGSVAVPHTRTHQQRSSRQHPECTGSVGCTHRTHYHQQPTAKYLAESSMCTERGGTQYSTIINIGNTRKSTAVHHLRTAAVKSVRHWQCGCTHNTTHNVQQRTHPAAADVSDHSVGTTRSSIPSSSSINRCIQAGSSIKQTGGAWGAQ
jgi:hypothetical protein